MITQPFKQAIDQNNVDRVKIMLRSSLSNDLTFQSFQEMLTYAVNHFPHLIEPHDGMEFSNSSVWTKTYASEVREDLMDNFSAERIAHIKEVHEYVYAKERNEQLNLTATTIYGTKRAISSVNIALLITTLGVASASILVGVLLDLSIAKLATTTVVASIVIGGTTYYLVKKSK